MEPIISVIIPFYNVEEYADQCMQSLVAQDYCACEFICIDDGSTDNTLSVLNKYSYDQRVKIIHKNNEGLSATRNYGLSIAKGQYVTFVDGDDFVHPKYLSSLILASGYQNNIVVVSPMRIIKYKRNNDYKSDWDDNISFTIIDKSSLVKEILYNNLSVSACGKLVPRTAYNDTFFPVGKVSEDVATLEKLIIQYYQFAVLSRPVYKYVMRPNSITHKENVSYKDIEDRCNAYDLFENALKREMDLYDDKIRNAFIYRRALSSMELIVMCSKVTDDKQKVRQKLDELITWLRSTISFILNDKTLSLISRMRVWLCCFSPKLYISLYTKYQKIRYNV